MRREKQTGTRTAHSGETGVVKFKDQYLLTGTLAWSTFFCLSPFTLFLNCLHPLYCPTLSIDLNTLYTQRLRLEGLLWNPSPYTRTPSYRQPASLLPVGETCRRTASFQSTWPSSPNLDFPPRIERKKNPRKTNTFPVHKIVFEIISCGICSKFLMRCNPWRVDYNRWKYC